MWRTMCVLNKLQSQEYIQKYTKNEENHLNFCESFEFLNAKTYTKNIQVF